MLATVDFDWHFHSITAMPWRNRLVNMETGFWFKGSADPFGRGHAAGKVCPTHLPFGQIKGNVCHDNRRFGSFDRDVENIRGRHMEDIWKTYLGCLYGLWIRMTVELFIVFMMFLYSPHFGMQQEKKGGCCPCDIPSRYIEIPCS